MLRTLLLACLLPASLAALATLFTVPLPAGYHHFADRSVVGGLHHFGDIVSNLAFLAAGLFVFARARSGAEYWLAAALVLACAGSWYYHFAPDDLRLLADRIPIAMACAAMAAIILFERREGMGLVYAGTASLVFMAAAAHAYWSGNQAIWASVQIYVLLLLAFAAFTRPRVRAASLAALALYGAAKVFEGLDLEVHELTGFVSGHTVKHVLAALAPVAWFVLRDRAGHRESWLAQCWRPLENTPTH